MDRSTPRRMTADADPAVLRLIAVANELLAMASQIEQGSIGPKSTSAARPGDAIAAGHIEGDHPLWAELAREHYGSRRRRDKVFGNEGLFGEPAWDILLDLFIAAKEKRQVSVMSACIGAAVPSTTALRWITALERELLLTREGDPADARRTYVGLSARGYSAMVEYFGQASRSVKGSAFTRLAAFEQAERGAGSGGYRNGNGHAETMEPSAD